VIIFNREGPDACSDRLNIGVEGGTPALFIGCDTGFGFFNVAYNEDACRAGDGTTSSSRRPSASLPSASWSCRQGPLPRSSNIGSDGLKRS
jgi:hypothetical protein